MRTRRTNSAVVVLSFAAALSLLGRGDGSAAALATTVTVPISGTVSGQPESVSLSGNLLIVSTFVTDSTLAVPKERLSLELVDVSGIGLTSGAKYVATGEDRLLRQLALSDHIEIMFPFYPATAGGARSARSAMASVTLEFNLLSGALTRATATFSSPRLPS